MSRPQVSVIVPVYNAEKYISECIKSVLAQSYTDLELILIDDGSTDRSTEICNQYKEKDTRVFVFHQTNGGVAYARNTGIEKSKGEYLLFIDADDSWHPNFVENMLLAKRSSDLPICKMIKCKSDGTIIDDTYYNCDMNEWCWPIINNYSISCWRCMFERRIVKEQNLRFTIGRRTGEDQEFAFKYMLLCDRITFAPEAEYYYRINPSSAMFQKNYCHFDAVEAMKSVSEYSKTVLPVDKADLIVNAIRCYKYPYILEFAILTLMTAGESPKKLLTFLREEKYDNLLQYAIEAESHFDSCFIRLWQMNPSLCLYYYYARRLVGKLFRKLGVHP